MFMDGAGMNIYVKGTGRGRCLFWPSMKDH